ncbi:MAG: rod shape-determining protein MreC [Alphaproteobacteria bacterium]
MAARKPKPFSTRVLLPSKQWTGRAGVLFMVCAAMTLFAMNKAENPAVIKLRTSIADAVVPVLGVLARPVDAVRSAGAWVSEMTELRAENIRLKNENLQLTKWQTVAREMEAENRTLRNMLHVIPQQHKSYITVRIVSDIAGPFVHAALVNGGTQAGIKQDQAIIAEGGLVGRVVEAGERSARVLLLTDINSRVPVVTEVSREKSIMMGRGHELPSLSYLAAGSKVAVGERVVTSGDGGIFPPGIPVGIVSSVDGGLRVKPLVDPAKTAFVSAVDYTF